MKLNFYKKIPIKMRKNQFKGVVMAIKRTVLLSTCALPLAQPLHAAEVQESAPVKVRPFSLTRSNCWTVHSNMRRNSTRNIS